jgi:uncharacterized Zn finger protein
MSRITERDTGLFPSPREIEFECSCPDYAAMCKHIAAVLYGVGARLDNSPELLFALRGVDHLELIAQAGKDMHVGGKAAASEKFLAVDDLSAMFGIDVADMPAPSKPKKRQTKKTVAPAAVQPAKAVRAAKKPLKVSPTGPAQAKPGKPTARPRRKTLSAVERKAIAARMRAQWAARRAEAVRRSCGLARLPLP